MQIFAIIFNEILKNQLDQINNSKHEDFLYKELYQSVDNQVQLMGPSPGENQNFVVYDFRGKSTPEIVAEFNERESDELSIETVQQPNIEIRENKVKSKVSTYMLFKFR